MRYKIYIQDNYIETLEASSTGEILKIVGQKIKNQEITYDNTQPINLKIEPE
jgi:hypothetical protein